MELIISIFFWCSLTAWSVFFVLLKIELQAANPDKDYMLRRHFSIWSDMPEIIAQEKDKTKKRKLKRKYRYFNISTVLVFVSLIIFFSN